MEHSTSAPSARPSPPGTPSEAETQDRMAFQMVHSEVGFAFRDGRHIAYWADANWKPQYREAGSLGALLDILRPIFP